MNINKQNWSLYLAIALPIVLVAVIALSIYLPNAYAKPQYDFIYQSQIGPNYYDHGTYTVTNGKIVVNPAPYYSPDGVSVPPKLNNNVSVPAKETDIPIDVQLYYYNVQKNTSTQISFADAQKYTLDTTALSKDNYHVEYGNSGSGPFSSGSDYSKVFLVGHSAHRQLNIYTQNYYNSFLFLGWVQK